MTKMAAKGSDLTGLSVAIAAALAMAGSIAPLCAAQAKAVAVAAASTDAIIGTGRSKHSNAIIGTGANAIIGTGVNAIIGTGANGNAIIGTGSQKLVVARGPIDSFDLKTGTATVMGRTFAFPQNGKGSMAIRQSLLIGDGAQVTVFGKLAADGSLKAPSIAIDSTQYVAGASEVVASGRVTKVDAAVGKATVGRVVIDYTALLASKEISLKLGELVVVVGTRPAQDSAVQATSVTTIGN
jgi:hypothetical protein